ncbi:MAG TPA: molybdenum cofactor biosynthesis protein MoaE [Marmoricola sp.]|jgi:molybdopterin synthase catalytic subunit|nr:molybdenum cofactor biosynthesis protein MoaE [Marmoricola sp.]
MHALPVVRLVDIQDRPLDVTQVLAALVDDVAGGITLFVGTVRNHDHGESVTTLDYSAHPRALDELRAVVEAVAARHDVEAVAAVHRVGDLVPGDLAVIVGAATRHRAESFAAARDLIEDLKAQVPIWKHQSFDDGSEEWVGTP